MKTYIGTKIVKLQSMTRAEYNGYRGWALPADEDGTDEGYLVEYTDGGAPNHANHDGYISWSPKAQADAAYRPTDGMSFGLAIEALKKGFCVARAGWNGKGMHLYLEDSLYRSMPRASVKGKITYSDLGKYEPCLVMFTAQQKHQPGWLASQADMLADDWQIVDPA